MQALTVNFITNNGFRFNGCTPFADNQEQLRRRSNVGRGQRAHGCGNFAIAYQRSTSGTKARKEAGDIMILGRKANSIIVGLASLGLFLQASPTFAGPPARTDSNSAKVNLDDAPVTAESKPAPKKVVPPAAIDVAMAKNGMVVGRVLNADQTGAKDTEVSIRQGKLEVAKVVTDQDGRFEIANLKGGLYVVAANSGYGLFRFWTAKSAPPKSHQQVLLMSKSIVVRAQNNNDGGEVLYDENGQPYARTYVVDDGVIATPNMGGPGMGGGFGPVGANLGSLNVFTVATAGAAAAGLAVGAVALSNQDDSPASP